VVSQWIVRREFVADAAQAAGLNLSDLTFVESEGSGTDGAPDPLLTLGGGRNEHHASLRKTFYGLALVALFLAGVNWTHQYWRQQRILDNLNTGLATAQDQARQVRAAMDKLDQKQGAIVRLRLQKRDVPGLLEIWEEVSTLLPANSWLTELHRDCSEIGPVRHHDRAVERGGGSRCAC
jgi:general secretion pathway protein L